MVNDGPEAPSSADCAFLAVTIAAAAKHAVRQMMAAIASLRFMFSPGLTRRERFSWLSLRARCGYVGNQLRPCWRRKRAARAALLTTGSLEGWAEALALTNTILSL